MAIKLIAFDFDGTLIDTAPDIISATNDFLELHGRSRLSHQEITEHIGQGLIGLLRGVVPEAERHPEVAQAVVDQFSKIYDQHVLVSPRPFDGVVEFLNQWQNRGKMAIVSNKPERYIWQILHHLGLNRYNWSSVIGGDSLSACKPDPLPLKTAMAAAHAAPDETLMVGDGPPDVGVAKATGCHLLAVSFGYSTIEELKSLGAEHWIGQFSELIAHLERIT